jgi:hypothetical protein
LIAVQSAWFFFIVLVEIVSKYREALKLLERIPVEKNM